MVRGMVSASAAGAGPRRSTFWLRTVGGDAWEEGLRLKGRRAVAGRAVAALLTLLAVTALQLAFFSPQARALEETPDAGTWHVTGGRVQTSALSEDGKTLYIGGNFNKVWEMPPGTGGESFTANGLAAIDVESGGAIPSWNPQVSGGEAHIHSLAVRGNSVFAGGNFSAVNGQPRRNLAELDATNGSLRPFAPQVGDSSDIVRAVETSSSKLYIGGQFTLVDGNGRGNIAAFDLADRSLDPQWTPRADTVVRALEMAVDGETIFAGGSFLQAQGSNDADFSSRRTVARFYAESGDLHPWYVPEQFLSPTSPQTNWVLLATPTRLYGGFGDKGPNYVKRFRLDSGDAASQDWTRSFVGDPYALALSPDGSRLFVGGHFGTVRLQQQECGKPVKGLISLNPQNGQPYCDWIPRMELFDKDQLNGHTVNTIQSTGNYAWVGGSFYTVNDVEQRNLARFTLVPPPEVIPDPTPIGDVRVNFQTGDAPVPAGYAKDFGEKFGSRAGADQSQGLYYGWVQPGTDNRISLIGEGRDRNTNADQRLDTLMHMQRSTEGAWEILVPNGAYETTVSVGDAGFMDSVYRLNIEGQNAINNAVPTNANRFFNVTTTVEVTDERLTLDALGGQNTKINYVDIKSLDTNLVAEPQALDFGNKGIGGNPKSLQFVLENTGSSDITIEDVAVGGADAEDFTATLSGGSTLPPGQETAVVVDFLPHAVGSKTATLTVNHSGDNPAVQVGLAGQALPNGQGCTIVGTGGDDEIEGTEGDDVICGYGGADVIYGRGGNDEIYGQAGPDELYGEEGDDLLVGGPGDDLLDGGPGNNVEQQ